MQSAKHLLLHCRHNSPRLLWSAHQCFLLVWKILEALPQILLQDSGVIIPRWPRPLVNMVFKLEIFKIWCVSHIECICHNKLLELLVRSQTHAWVCIAWKEALDQFGQMNLMCHTAVLPSQRRCLRWHAWLGRVLSSVVLVLRFQFSGASNLQADPSVSLLHQTIDTHSADPCAINMLKKKPTQLVMLNILACVGSLRQLQLRVVLPWVAPWVCCYKLTESSLMFRLSNANTAAVAAGEKMREKMAGSLAAMKNINIGFNRHPKW